MRPLAGEWWQLRGGSRRAQVLEADRGGRAIVHRFADEEASERLPLGAFQRRFEPVLANFDFVDLLPLRGQVLIEDHSPLLKRRRVLELGAHNGGLTRVLGRHATRITAIENNRRCLPALRRALRPPGRVIAGDAHHALFELPRGRFDVVVCAGLLYHSAHPFLLLEGMARLRPKWILVDTLNRGVDEGGVLLREERDLNAINYRYNAHPDCGISTILGEHVIVAALSTLGYDLSIRIDKSRISAPEGRETPYFIDWRRSLSGWFRKREGRR